MKTLIIEDEKAALRNLKAVMQEVNTDFEIVGEVDSIFDGVEWFRPHPIRSWCLWTFIWPMVQPSISVRS